MKEENKKCWNCMWYEAYYTKGNCNLKKQNVGNCIKYNKIVCKSDICERWFNGYRKTDRCRRSAVNYLSEIYNKLSVIAEALQDANELEKLRNKN